MSTLARLEQWVDWWRSGGMVDDPGPPRPADVGEYHDELLRRAARNVATVARERGQ